MDARLLRLPVMGARGNLTGEEVGCEADFPLCFACTFGVERVKTSQFARVGARIHGCSCLEFWTS
jgi:hypothetical protein